MAHKKSEKLGCYEVLTKVSKQKTCSAVKMSSKTDHNDDAKRIENCFSTRLKCFVARLYIEKTV